MVGPNFPHESSLAIAVIDPMAVFAIDKFFFQTRSQIHHSGNGLSI